MDFDSGTSFVPRSHERHESLEKKRHQIDSDRSFPSLPAIVLGDPHYQTVSCHELISGYFRNQIYRKTLRWLTSWLSIKTIKRLWEGMTELYHYRHDEKHVPTDGRWSSSVLRVRGMKRRGNGEDFRAETVQVHFQSSQAGDEKRVLVSGWWFHFRPSQRKKNTHTK